MAKASKKTSTSKLKSLLNQTGQNKPQSERYSADRDSSRKAKPGGWRWTDAGAKKMGVNKNSRPTKLQIEMFKDKFVRGDERYLYEESRVDKSDVNQGKKFGSGGKVPKKEPAKGKGSDQSGTKGKPSYSDEVNLVYLAMCNYKDTRDQDVNEVVEFNNGESVFVRVEALQAAGITGYEPSRNKKFGMLHKEKDQDKIKDLLQDLEKKEGSLYCSCLEDGEEYGRGGRVKRSKLAIAMDKQRKAEKPGKRESAEGNTYYENRPNHADEDRRIKLEKGGTLDRKYIFLLDGRSISEKVQEVYPTFTDQQVAGVDEVIYSFMASLMGEKPNFALSKAIYEIHYSKPHNKGQDEFFDEAVHVLEHTNSLRKKVNHKVEKTFAEGGTVDVEEQKYYDLLKGRYDSVDEGEKKAMIRNSQNQLSISRQFSLDNQVNEDNGPRERATRRFLTELGQPILADHILGRTQSGKFIYDAPPHQEFLVGPAGLHSDFMDRYHDFDEQDHRDAYALHQGKKEEANQEWERHYNSVTPDEWNDERNEKGKAALKGTKAATQAWERHDDLGGWHGEHVKGEYAGGGVVAKKVRDLEGMSIDRSDMFESATVSAPTDEPNVSRALFRISKPFLGGLKQAKTFEVRKLVGPGNNHVVKEGLKTLDEAIEVALDQPYEGFQTLPDTSGDYSDKTFAQGGEVEENLLKGSFTLPQLNDFLHSRFPDGNSISVYRGDLLDKEQYGKAAWTDYQEKGRNVHAEIGLSKVVFSLDRFRLQYNVREGSEHTYISFLIEAHRDKIMETYTVVWSYNYDTSGVHYIGELLQLLHEVPNKPIVLIHKGGGRFASAHVDDLSFQVQKVHGDQYIVSLGEDFSSQSEATKAAEALSQCLGNIQSIVDHGLEDVHMQLIHDLAVSLAKQMQGAVYWTERFGYGEYNQSEAFKTSLEVLRRSGVDVSKWTNLDELGADHLLPIYKFMQTVDVDNTEQFARKYADWLKAQVDEDEKLIGCFMNQTCLVVVGSRKVHEYDYKDFHTLESWKSIQSRLLQGGASDGRHRIANEASRALVEIRQPFVGKNLEGRILDNGDFLVSSFSHYPLWLYQRGQWFGDNEVPNQTMKLHQSQSRPSFNVHMISHQEMLQKLSPAESYDLGEQEP
jgi:hypothetical protein